MSEVGNKNDSGKPRISLIPKEALWGMANAFTYGANKYAAHNFKNGIDYSRLADAAMRHLSAYMDGENIDDESGNCHLDHALASLAMLKFMSVNRKENDDRYKMKLTYTAGIDSAQKLIKENPGIQEIKEELINSSGTEFEILPGIKAREIK